MWKDVSTTRVRQFSRNFSVCADCAAGCTTTGTALPSNRLAGVLGEPCDVSRRSAPETNERTQAMRLGCCVGLLLLTVGLVPGVKAEPAEDQKLADFFKAFLDEELKARPLEATRLGDHRF